MKQRAGKLMSGQESLHILPYLIAVFLSSVLYLIRKLWDLVRRISPC
ncbi:hypothetical protein [Hoylesella pleuritidis]|nr:hypothetical protein [Hoylesella pleuritidis]